MDEHAEKLRYVAAWSKWFHWGDGKWKKDVTLHTVGLARDLCREVGLRRAKVIYAVEQLARCDDLLKATVEQWDARHDRINANGTLIELSKPQAHRPTVSEDYCLKSCSVAPKPGTPLLFLKFLDRIMGGDKEMIAYLKRIFGYALTGETSEHAMFFFYGTGANGKSVLLATIAGILADYHKTSPIETFTVSALSNHPTDIAGLMGARLVTSVETEEGRRWAESRIKYLTGGDRVSARFMRQDFFEFIPQFKLIVAGNHKPSLRTVDEAMRRRLHFVPFTVTIPEAERDPNLALELQQEWPQILTWMIEGCHEWQRRGLDAPKAVKDATRAYFEAQDTISAWIEEHCELGPNFKHLRTPLFLSWQHWCEKTGEFAGDQKTFFDKLEQRGFEPVRTNAGRFFRGIKLQWDTEK